MAENLSLFKEEEVQRYKPLADRLRPASWNDFFGSDSFDSALLQQIEAGEGVPPSLVLWGPPGSGKTTFAKLVGDSFDCRFVELSAVLAGVKEVRAIVSEAELNSKFTLLFVDEIHRFNKSQQDAFLPHIERGTIVLIGATTENPSFYLNPALRSRVRVIQMPALGADELRSICDRALAELQIEISDKEIDQLIKLAGGDARRLLNSLENWSGELDPTLFYDRDGDEHYGMISAFIKSMRGSDPDASLYWGFRMIESGEDPRYILRRMLIFASEDIGNGDPRALQIANSTFEAFEKLGLPEGKIPIAQCITYLACAPKTNRSYKAMHAAIAAVKENPKVDVPIHLKNAPTSLMKELGYGENYDYPHSHDEGHAAGVQYLPDELLGEEFYKPSSHGYEKVISEQLKYWRERRDTKDG